MSILQILRYTSALIVRAARRRRNSDGDDEVAADAMERMMRFGSVEFSSVRFRSPSVINKPYPSIA